MTTSTNNHQNAWGATLAGLVEDLTYWCAACDTQIVGDDIDGRHSDDDGNDIHERCCTQCGDTDRYVPRFKGKSVTISWDDFYSEFKSGSYEWLDVSDTDLVERAAAMFADRCCDWYFSTIGQMRETEGCEVDEVLDQLVKDGFLMSDGGEW